MSSVSYGGHVFGARRKLDVFLRSFGKASQTRVLRLLQKPEISLTTLSTCLLHRRLPMLFFSDIPSFEARLLSKHSLTRLSGTHIRYRNCVSFYITRERLNNYDVFNSKKLRTIIKKCNTLYSS